MMASIKTIEAQIWKLESLEVKISGKGDHPGWDWANEASNNWTFRKWKEKRFNKLYPKLTAALKNGRPENTTLGTLRKEHE